MSDEEKKTEEKRFLSYKESTGNEVCIEISPDINVKERVGFLTKHGCTDFVLLDADKKPIEPQPKL